jgi:hypothetical protein
MVTRIAQVMVMVIVMAIHAVELAVKDGKL